MRKPLRKILITGSSGTIGTMLCETLLREGFTIYGFDKRHNRWNPKIDKLTIIGNLLNKDALRKIPSDIELVIHLAANARVYNLVVDPDLALENIIATYNILEFTRKNDIKQIIIASSREVYGNKRSMVSSEEAVDIQRCESPYSASKISTEALSYAFGTCYKTEYIVFRFSNVYGMYDDSDRFIPLTIKRMMKNEDVIIYGKKKVLDFTYIDDCVNGIVNGIKSFRAARNNVFNIASSEGSRLVDVANLIKRMLNSKSRIVIQSNRQGEVIKFIADISKAKKELFYEPQYSITRGLALSIKWYLRFYHSSDGES